MHGEGLALLGDDASFVVLADTWYTLLPAAVADCSAADCAAGPFSASSTDGFWGDPSPLLEYLHGSVWSAAMTPYSALGSSHLDLLLEGSWTGSSSLFYAGERLRREGEHQHAVGCHPVAAAMDADAAGGGGGSVVSTSGGCCCHWKSRLCREEWTRLLSGCLEAWGPRMFLQKAAAASSLSGDSLLGRLILHDSAGSSAASDAAIMMVLRATGWLGRSPEALRDALRHTLPDGEAIVASKELARLLRIHMPHWAGDAPVEAPLADAELAQPLDRTLRLAANAHERPDVTQLAAQAAEEYCPVPSERLGANIASALVREPARDSGTSMLKCCVCFEDVLVEELRVCGRAGCGQSPFCLACLKRYAECVIRDGLYAVPCVRCLSCNKRLATDAWSPHVSEEMLQKYRENASALLTYRCPACDETSSYLADAAAPTAESVAAVARRMDPGVALEPEAHARLLAAWNEFFLAELSSDDFLQVIMEVHACGSRTGGVPPARLNRFFGPSGAAPWIADLERRLTLQLAWLHRFPRQRTACCGERFCFTCKISSWHAGITCRERMQVEKTRQAQLCPACGVPTQRSEGCRSIACVCGRVWEWEGEESSEEGTISDSLTEDSADGESQTAINLLAMNVWTPAEVLREAVSLLVSARANVNDGAEAARAPLQLATQCQNVAAVEILLDQGAQVQTSMLDELKLISNEDVRRRIEALALPLIQADTSTKLPMWVWVQGGCVPAVDALMRNASHVEVIDVDVFTALSRCTSNEGIRLSIAARIREQVGEETFRDLERGASTKGLLLELRQSWQWERVVDVALVRRLLAADADPNGREEDTLNRYEDEDSRRFSTSALGLLAMNSQTPSAASVEEAIGALIEARADLNSQADESSTPLQAALKYRNIPAIRALCRGGDVPWASSEVLDEFRTVSEPSKRHSVNSFLRPLVRNNFKRRLPLWLLVQMGDVVAVEAILRSEGSHAQVNADALVALQRFHGDDADRERLDTQLRSALGPEAFGKLWAVAATRRMVQELREAYDDQRSVLVEVIREALEFGADPNAKDDDHLHDFEVDMRTYNLPALHLLVTNLKTPAEPMCAAVTAMSEAGADVNATGMDPDDTPLLAAVRQRCVAGVQALSSCCVSQVVVTAPIFEELKSISSGKVRVAMEDYLQPLIHNAHSLRVPMWVWVQAGSTLAVEALLRNEAHEEEIDEDVLIAFQRCRGTEAAQQRILKLIVDRVDEAELQRLQIAAATRRMLMELREAHTDKRSIDLDLLRETLDKGANVNASEESLDNPGEDEDESDDEEEDENEDEEDSHEDENEEGDSDAVDDNEEKEASEGDRPPRYPEGGAEEEEGGDTTPTKVTFGQLGGGSSEEDEEGEEAASTY